MFGYIGVNKPELKIKDFETYQGYYCGLCRALGRQTGRFSQLTLTYDMTFLALLLTGLYEEEGEWVTERCPVHPWKKCRKIVNSCTEYAAQVNVLLAYYNLLDDWEDDRSLKSLLLACLIRGKCRKLQEAWPRQSRAIEEYLKKLHQCESTESPDLDLAAGLTGEMLAEIFVYREDCWSPHLRRMGFFLGKFIYLMDAYEDLDEDRTSGSYNPWKYFPDSEHFDDDCQSILTMMMSEASRAFERLPILINADILRNVLYSGVWSKFETVRAQRNDPDFQGRKKRRKQRNK